MNIHDIQMQSVQRNYNEIEIGSKSGVARGESYHEILQSLNKPTQNLEEMWKGSFEKWFHQNSGQFFYHVMDVPEISESTWQHNDFPYDRLMQKNLDSSALLWQPSRGNPSQLDVRVQAKTQATLGKNSIIVPPELEERMRHDPELTQKVFENIDRVYAFHRPMPHLAMPGTKFYGTKVYGSVIVLNKDGEVEHSCVTSGGGILGPDEKTLRQIEREQEKKQEKKQERKEENRRVAKEAELEYIDDRWEMLRYWQGDVLSVGKRSSLQAIPLCVMIGKMY